MYMYSTYRVHVNRVAHVIHDIHVVHVVSFYVRGQGAMSVMGCDVGGRPKLDYPRLVIWGGKSISKCIKCIGLQKCKNTNTLFTQ